MASGAMPRLTKGSATFAVSEMMRMSAGNTMVRPTPMALPFMAAIVTEGEVPVEPKFTLSGGDKRSRLTLAATKDCARDKASSISVMRDGHVARRAKAVRRSFLADIQIRPCAKRLAGTGENDDADTSVSISQLEGKDEGAAHCRGEGVHPCRPIKCDNEDAVLELGLDVIEVEACIVEVAGVDCSYMRIAVIVELHLFAWLWRLRKENFLSSDR